MKQILFFAMLIGPSSVARAQSVEDSVKAAVNNLFTAMKNSDASLLRNCFADSAVLQTIAVTKEGKVTVKNDSVDDFANSVGEQKKGSLDERIQFDVVKVDGPLAIAWTPYSFYFDGKFSHCGVNSFQLVRTAAGWKIQYIIDTRRRKDCK